LKENSESTVLSLMRQSDFADPRKVHRQAMLFGHMPTFGQSDKQLQAIWLSRACTDLNCLCYNSVTEHGQMFCVAVPVGGFGAVWLTVHLLSI
jgi:hypothetical protein